MSQISVNDKITRQSIFGNGLIEKIREKFSCIDEDSISGRRIFFEAAGGTLRLKSVVETMAQLTALPDNDGRNNPSSQWFKEVLKKGRKDVALFMGAKSGKIISEQSTTSMVFRILGTVTREVSGRNIVASNLDHPCTYDGCRLLAARHGLEFRQAELDPQTGIVPVKNVMEKIDQQTVALAIIQASNVVGTKNDILQIVRQARRIKPDLYIIIDGAQHACHGLIDVEAYQADAWIFPPYKVYGKLGISFAHLSDRLGNLPHEKLLGKPEDFWDLGTREPAAFAAMSKVVEYYQWLGAHFTDNSDSREQIVQAMLAIQEYEQELLQALLSGTDQAPGLLDLKKLTILGQTADMKNHESIIAFNVAGEKSADVVQYLGKNGIRCHNRISDAYSRHTLEAFGVEECVRISLCHYNNIDEINIFLKLLAQYCEKSFDQIGKPLSCLYSPRDSLRR